MFSEPLTQACNKEKKSKIVTSHVEGALRSLKFEQYVSDVLEAEAEYKESQACSHEIALPLMLAQHSIALICHCCNAVVLILSLLQCRRNDRSSRPGSIRGASVLRSCSANKKCAVCQLAVIKCCMGTVGLICQVEGGIPSLTFTHDIRSCFEPKRE